MESKSFLDLVKKEILEKCDYNLNGTEVILSKRPSFTYNFDENGNLKLNGLGIVKGDVIPTTQGSTKIYGDETVKGIIQLIKFELEELCYGSDYLILLDVINRVSWIHQVDGRRYYHMCYRGKTINKPINKRKIMSNEQSNQTVIETIYKGLAEELGYQSAKSKLIHIVPKSLREDASFFLTKLENEKSRMRNNLVLEDKKLDVLEKIATYKEEMESVRGSIDKTFEMMENDLDSIMEEVDNL